MDRLRLKLFRVMIEKLPAPIATNCQCAVNERALSLGYRVHIDALPFSKCSAERH